MVGNHPCFPTLSVIPAGTPTYRSFILWDADAAPLRRSSPHLYNGVCYKINCFISIFIRGRGAKFPCQFAADRILAALIPLPAGSAQWFASC